MIRGYDGLSKFSQEMYKERYYDETTEEDHESWLQRVSSSYSDDDVHAERIREYIRAYWFHPSTPISSNAGLPSKGLPISCYTNAVEDSKDGIFATWEENNWLGSYGGGIGTTWRGVREIGANIGGVGKSSGIIPFIKVSDSTTLAVSQGGLRRASQAVYIDIDHPEIGEFIDVRRPTGDKDRRSTNIHHGIAISDAFMFAVQDRKPWNLISPKTGNIVATVDAFDLFKKILISRVETGEPYLLFIDTVNRLAPLEYRENHLSVVTSNLCSEITLYTDDAYSGVCCLTSMNLEYWDEFKDNYQFFEDIHRYTDNVLQSFIDDTKEKKGFEKTRRSAIRERSLGVGVMGFHQYLQSKGLPFGCLSSDYINKDIFSTISSMFLLSNYQLAIEKGTAPLSFTKRNVHVTAIAPTASISTLCNLSSPGIDPRVANVYTAKTNIGAYTIKNKYLEKLMNEVYRGLTPDKTLFEKWKAEQWKSILKNDGSVQHLSWMSDADKEVFKTSYEIDNAWIVKYACDRAPFIDQAASTNLFIPADVNVQKLYDLHMDAWKGGVKSLYYLRSNSINRAVIEDTSRECLSCQ